MLTVYNQFSIYLDEVDSFIDVFADLLLLPAHKTNTTTSRTAFTNASKRLHRKISATNRIDVVAYDGSFLHICAGFELAIRGLVERYIEKAALRCPNYSHLPPVIRAWYPEGCTEVILKLSHAKFAHLTSTVIVQSLSATARNLSNNLITEAFSNTERNFSSTVIEDCFGRRLGIVKIWQKVAREPAMQTLLGTTNVDTAERRAKATLDQLIKRRNDLIHRGRAYYTASPSKISDTIAYFKALVAVLAGIMEAHVLTL